MHALVVDAALSNNAKYNSQIIVILFITMLITGMSELSRLRNQHAYIVLGENFKINNIMLEEGAYSRISRSHRV